MFNVCLVQPSGYIHSMALLEAAEYVCLKIREAGYESKFQINRLSREKVNIVFGAHLNPEGLLDAPERLVIFNTEQLPDKASRWNNEKYRTLLDQSIVWDYATGNMELLKSPIVSIVNFAYCRGLDRIKRSDDQNIDLLFYGSINDHRKKVLTGLKSLGLRVEALFGVYGSERDERISKSHAILNLNYYTSAIFPQVRSFYALTNGIPVISESWAAGSAPEFHEEALFSAGGADLIEYTAELFRDKMSFIEQANAKLNRFKAFKDATFLEALNLLDSAIGFSTIPVRNQYFFPKKINLGSGNNYKFGYLNVDTTLNVKPDIVLDLSQRDIEFPLVVNGVDGEIVIDEGQFDELVAYNVLEKVIDLRTLMSNCLRILKVGGVMRVRVPYDLSYGAWQDPTHVRAFNQKSWLCYTDRFWQLEWHQHRFSIERLEYQLSEVGLLHYKSNKILEEILTIPRAVDLMEVDLRKVELNSSERQISNTYTGVQTSLGASTIG